MAATRKQVDELFALLEAKLPNRGYFLGQNGNRVSLQRHTKDGDVEISPYMTPTPMHTWLLIILKGIELAQSPLPTSEKCPICDGKLLVYESLPAPRWTYLCSHCEETGTIVELQEIARTKGE
jgi:hypothetical protein